MRLERDAEEPILEAMTARGLVTRSVLTDAA